MIRWLQLVLTFSSLTLALVDKSIVLQPGPENGVDCQITNNITGTGGTWGNYNTGKVQCMGIGPYDLNTITRGLIKFELPTTMRASDILKADLILSTYYWKSGDTTKQFQIEVHQMLKSWKEGLGAGVCEQKELNTATIDGATGIVRFWEQQGQQNTWNAPNVGMDDIDSKKLPEAISTKTNYKDMTPWLFDITQLCKDWVSGDVPNYGLLIRNAMDLCSEGKCTAYPIFYTSDADSASKRPYLKIWLNDMLSVSNEVNNVNKNMENAEWQSLVNGIKVTFSSSKYRCAELTVFSLQGDKIGNVSAKNEEHGLRSLYWTTSNQKNSSGNFIAVLKTESGSYSKIVSLVNCR